MNAQLIPDDTLLDDLHPSRFLKVADLLDRWHVQKMIVTVSRMTREETVPNTKDIDLATDKPRIVIQPVFYFIREGKSQEWPSGYLLSAQTDVQSLKTATKARTTGEVKGKRVVIEIGEHRKQKVLRISPMPPMDPKREPPDMKLQGHTHSDDAHYNNCPKCNPKTGEVIEATCKKCGMLARVNPETQRFYSHQNVAGETCNG